MSDATEYQPRYYSPFEPIYLRRYQKLIDGSFSWDIQVEEPRRQVGGGICDTLALAREAAQQAIDQDLKELAETLWS